jgi:hypothetical protein
MPDRRGGSRAHEPTADPKSRIDLAELVDRLAAELRAADNHAEVLRIWVSGQCHTLNNPVASIVAAASLLVADTSHNDPLNEAFVELQRRAESIRRVCQRICSATHPTRDGRADTDPFEPNQSVDQERLVSRLKDEIREAEDRADMVARVLGDAAVELDSVLTEFVSCAEMIPQEALPDEPKGYLVGIVRVARYVIGVTQTMLLFLGKGPAALVPDPPEPQQCI